jgi:lipopolysaccharide transport system permease protein
MNSYTDKVAAMVEASHDGERLVVYDARPALLHPRPFLERTLTDLRVVPSAGWRMFRRNLRANHRPTLLGYSWLFVVPLVGTLTWIFLSAAGVVRGQHTQVPYVVYVLSGVLLWQMFVEIVNSPLQSLETARRTLAKSHLPHETYIFAGLLAALFNAIVRFLLLVVVLAIVGFSFRWDVLLAPFGVLTLIVFALALGMLAVPLGMLYADVGRGLSVITTVWFFLTPVIYARHLAGLAGTVVSANPMTPLLDTTRSWMVGEKGAEPLFMAIVFAVAALVLAAALLMNRLARPHVVARL